MKTIKVNFKTLNIVCVIMVIVMIQACSGSTSPEDVAIKAATYLIEGEYSKLMDISYIPEGMSKDEVNEREREAIHKVREKANDPDTTFGRVLKEIKDNGGYKKIRVEPFGENERIIYYDDLDTGEKNIGASVDIVVICKNGEEVSGLSIRLKRDGKIWKLS